MIEKDIEQFMLTFHLVEAIGSNEAVVFIYYLFGYGKSYATTFKFIF